MGKFLFKILVLVFIFLISPLAFLQASPSEWIDSYDVYIKIQEDSSIEIQETIQYNFGSNFKRGIYRTIPTVWKRDGRRYHLEVSGIQAFDSQGNDQLFGITHKRREVRVDLGSDIPEFTGNQTFIIRYKVEAALEHKDDYDALLWNAIGTGWSVSITNSSVLVELPETTERDLLRSDCFAGQEGSRRPCAEIGYQLLSGEEDNLVSGIVYRHSELSRGEGITIDVFLPKGLVSEAERKEAPSTSWILLFIFFGAGLMPFAYTLTKFFRESSDPDKNRVVVTQYDVPREVTPANVGILLNRSFRNNALVAELLSLAIRGYIKIVYGKTKFLFVFKKPSFLFLKLRPEDDLSPTEKTIMKRVFNNRFTISKKETSEYFQEEIVGLEEDIASSLDVVSTEKFKDSTNKFFEYFKEIKKAAKEEVINKGYFKTSFKIAHLQGMKSASFSLLLTVLILFVPTFIYLSLFQGYSYGDIFALSLPFLAFLSFFIIFVFSIVIKTKLPGRTEKGAELKRHMLGLKHYIKVAERERMDFHFDPKKNPELFEKLLPYAVVLGEQESWVNHLSSLEYQPEWYRSSTPGSLSVSGLNTMVSSLSSTSSSSGGGGSGGVGGGGGGGGGGSR